MQFPTLIATLIGAFVLLASCGTDQGRVLPGTTDFDDTVEMPIEESTPGEELEVGDDDDNTGDAQVEGDPQDEEFVDLSEPSDNQVEVEVEEEQQRVVQAPESPVTPQVETTPVAPVEPEAPVVMGAGEEAVVEEVVEQEQQNEAEETQEFEVEEDVEPTYESTRAEIKALGAEIKSLNLTLKPFKQAIKEEKERIASDVADLKAERQALRLQMKDISSDIKEIRQSDMSRDDKRAAIADLREERNDIKALVNVNKAEEQAIRGPLNTLKQALKDQQPVRDQVKALKTQRRELQEFILTFMTESEVTCSSQNYQRAECGFDQRIRRFEVVEVLSNSACTKGESYGKRGKTLWVDAGCRATFRVWIK